ncbi:MAG: nitroreductase family protein [Burkholderiaceae bacterium]
MKTDIAAPTMHAAIERRYREAVAPLSRLDGPWNDTLATMLSHRSVRGYLSTPLPDGALEMMVAAAQSASTSSNKQFWSVVAVRDPARKARLAAIAGGQKHIEQAPLQLVWLADMSRITDAARARGVALEATEYLESFLVAVVDAALAAQNAALAAQSLGLGVVYIGALRNDPEAVAAELGLPPRCFAVFGMCVGHPDPSAASDVKPRLPQSAVLHHERYDPDQADAIARYDAHHVDFRAEQGLGPVDWAGHMIGRLATIADLNGREVLKQALQRLGFAMR